MLIRFSLTETDLRSIEPERLEIAVSELLRSHRNGFHLVVIDRSTAEYLMHHLSLSGSDKALLQRLHQQFTQNGRLHEQASIYIELTGSGETVRREGRSFKFPFNLVDFSTFGSPSLFLTEDANYDAKLMNFVLRSVRDITGAPTFSFIEEHGGGSSTLQRYAAGLRAKKIGICVLDTDKRSPFSESCDVTKQAVKALAEFQWQLFDVVPLPCHELENVIPHCVVVMLDSAIGCDWNWRIPRIEN